MKNLNKLQVSAFLLGLFLIFGTAAKAQLVIYTDSITPYDIKVDSIFEQVDLSQTQTAFLLETTLSRVKPADYGELGSPPIDQFIWESVYHTFLTAQTRDSGLLDPWDSLAPIISEHLDDDVIPIGIIHWDYDRLNPDAIDLGLLSVDQSGRYLIQNTSSSPFIKESCFMATTMRKWGTEGKTFFILPHELFFESSTLEISQIEIDFDDGNGWTVAVEDQLIEVNYLNEGWKNIQYRALTSSGDYVYGGSKFKNLGLKKKYSSTNSLDGFDEHIIASSSLPNTDPAQAWISYRYACGDGKLRKPLIVAPGIEFKQVLELKPDAKFDLDAFLFWLDDDLEEKIERNGYDLVYINYDNGSDYIQNNAVLLEDVIKKVNQLKSANGSSEPNAVLGLSMGGVVARYGLMEMESKNETHDVEVFYSFDSPHNGANIPLSFQIAVDQLAGLRVRLNRRFLWFNITARLGLHHFAREVEYGRQMLEAPATCQLLESHLYAPTLGGVHTLRTDLLNQLSSWGEFPVQVSPRGVKIRNIALSNGNGGMLNQGFSPGADLIDINIDNALFNMLMDQMNFSFGSIDFESVNIVANMDAVPDGTMGSQTIYSSSVNIQMDVSGLDGSIVSQASADFATSRPLDNAPGGNYNYSPQTAIPGVNTHNDRFCFIPSVSSTALRSPYANNLYYDINGNWNSNTKSWGNGESPLDDLHIEAGSVGSTANGNTRHIYLSPGKVAFIENTITGMPNTMLDYDDMTKIATLTSQTYNMGLGTPASVMSIVVDNGGALKVNANEALGLSGSGNPLPVPGSFFQARTQGSSCANSVGILIKAGGTVQVGDNTTQNEGELIVMDGGVLEIESDGVLTVADNSKVIIDEGSQLIFNPGAMIYLEGENSVLEIRGELRIMGGATFTFLNSPGNTGGYMLFDKSYNSSIYSENSTGKMLLSGNNISGLLMDKVLEIVNGDLITPDASNAPTNYLAEFKVNNGMISIGSNSTLEVGGVSNFYMTYFVSLGGTPSYNTGLYLRNGHLATLNQCSFRDLDKGLFLDMNNFVSAPVVSYCSFKNNFVGLHTEKGGVELYNCSFSNNSIGWSSYFQNEDSRISQTNFGYNNYGIMFSFCDNVETLIEEATIVHNDYGINSEYSANSMNVTLGCSYIAYNDIRGIDFHGVGYLNMSPNYSPNFHTGGNNAFFNNGLAIYMGGTALYLEDGDNVFRNTGSWSGLNFIEGYLKNCPCSCYDPNISWGLLVGGNYWDASPAISVQVATTPNPSNVQLVGTNNSSFTSSCFDEDVSGTPVFINTWSGPQLKKNPGNEPTSVEQVDQDVKVYPNPANSYLVLRLGSEADDLSIVLTDVSGKVISVSNKRLSKTEWRIDLSGLSPGVYMLQGSMNSGKRFTERILITR